MYIDIFVLLLLICVAESVIMFSGPFHRPSGPSQLPGAGGTRRPDQTHRKNPEAFTKKNGTVSQKNPPWYDHFYAYRGIASSADEKRPR